MSPSPTQARIIALACLLALLLAPGAASAQGVVERVSVDGQGIQANGHSGYPSTSLDGRYVAFVSQASSLVAGDTNSARDVFVRDRTGRTTVRVSVSTGGGRYVAFQSAATNLVLGDSNGQYDVFVYDRETGVTERVSVARDGAQANSASYDPSISGDGRYVAFTSFASNLVANDNAGKQDIFVHDRQTGETVRVTQNAGYEANGRSYYPSISGDGRYVAFYSEATNLIAGDSNGKKDVFVFDRETGGRTRVSESGDGVQGDGDSTNARISYDGSHVAFSSRATNLVPADTNGCMDVFVRDLASAQTTRISVASDGTQADAASDLPGISGDGNVVSFLSYATNLVAGDGNGTWDTFARSAVTGATVRLSVVAEGAGGNNYSWGPPSVDATGAAVLFQSLASNLVADDTNNSYDVLLATEEVAPDWDVNEDGVCDFFDMVLIGTHWSETGAPHWIRSDANRDGLVDFFDLAVIGLHWSQTW